MLHQWRDVYTFSLNANYRIFLQKFYSYWILVILHSNKNNEHLMYKICAHNRSSLLQSLARSIFQSPGAPVSGQRHYPHEYINTRDKYWQHVGHCEWSVITLQLVQDWKWLFMSCLNNLSIYWHWNVVLKLEFKTKNIGPLCKKSQFSVKQNCNQNLR